MNIVADFTFFAYLISAFVASAILIVVTYTSYNITLDRIPKALRLYIKLCYLTFVFIISFLTLCYSAFYLFVDAPKVILMLNVLLPFTTQVMRSIFLTIIFERILATIFSQNYNLANKPWYFVLLTAIMLTFSFIFIAFFELNKSISSDKDALQLFAYTVLGIHVVIIVGFTLLYLLNKRTYKVTAYRTTLKTRHQIFANVKIISYLFPSILIFTMIAPWGALIMSIGFMFELPKIPLCIYHIFHNLPHLFICLQLNKMNMKNGIKPRYMAHVMDSKFAAIYNTERYFDDLRQQWN